MVLGQAMPLRLFVVPLLWLDQVLPSVVFRIVPLAPTAKQLVFALRQAMPLRSLVVPLVSELQELPLVVFRIFPPAPTA